MTNPLPFAVSLDLASGATGAVAYANALADAEGALAWLRDAYATKSLELLRVPERRDDIEAARTAAEKWRGNTTDVAVGGIEAVGGGKYLKDHFIVVTEPKSSTLRTFAENIGCPMLNHPMGVGGRYAVLTMVGVLPAVLLGLDVDALRAGAGDVVQNM